MQCIAAPARAQCFLPLFRTSHENSDNLLPPFVEKVRELAGAAANLSKSVGDEEPPFLPDFDPCLPLPFPVQYSVPEVLSSQRPTSRSLPLSSSPKPKRI